GFAAVDSGVGPSGPPLRRRYPAHIPSRVVRPSKRGKRQLLLRRDERSLLPFKLGSEGSGGEDWVSRERNS
ncbi:MAG: hypothetical protein ACKOA7_06875, partial [Bacteroidota bacterium]